MDCEYLMILQWKLFTELDQVMNIEIENKIENTELYNRKHITI